MNVPVPEQYTTLHRLRTFLHPWIGQPLAVLSLVILAGLAMGCSAETTEERSSTVDTIHALPVQSPVQGHELGQQSPEFTLRMADDTTLTLTQLMESDRPTFLFFWSAT